MAWEIWLLLVVSVWMLSKIVWWLALLPQEPTAVLIFTYWLEDDEPGPEYTARLETVVGSFANSHLPIYLFGGKLKGCVVSLAEAGKNYLISRGISPTRIFTSENLGLLGAADTSDELIRMQLVIRPGAGYYGVSNPYQLLRARLGAMALGSRLHPVYSHEKWGVKRAVMEIAFACYSLLDPLWRAPWCERFIRGPRWG